MNGTEAAAGRWCALLSAMCFLLIVVCVLAPGPGRALRSWQSATIYPWWALAMALGSLAVALASVLSPGRTVVAVAAAANGVCAAELAGLGLVARKHWQPAFGMGGGYSGSLPTLEWLALAVFVAGLAGAGLSLRRLVLAGELPAPASRGARRVASTVGAALVLLLPVAIGAGGRDQLDATSLGAYALVYSAPWGVATGLTGWLVGGAARAVLATCAACAALALGGPQMVDLVDPQPYVAFGLTLTVLLALLWLRLRDGTPGARRAGVEPLG